MDLIRVRKVFHSHRFCLHLGESICIIEVLIIEAISLLSDRVIGKSNNVNGVVLGLSKKLSWKCAAIIPHGVG